MLILSVVPAVALHIAAEEIPTENICADSEHTYETTAVQATTSADGSIVTQCTCCGDVQSSQTIPYVKTISLSATSYTYNGKVRTPTVTVKDSSGNVLQKDTDYTVSYDSGRKNAGTYKVTVKMMGNYTGTKTLSFKIKPIDISKCTVKLAATSYTYNGKVREPAAIVQNGSGSTLKMNTHYKVSYSSGRVYPGTYKVTVKMMGNYTGTKTLSFKIKPIDISKCIVRLSKTSYTYDGKVKSPTLTALAPNGTELEEGTHYTLSYDSGRKNIGTYKVTVTMMGNYTGTKTLSFKIKPINISKCTVKLAAQNLAYNGKVQKPAVTVKNATGTTLKEGKHYTLSYDSGRKNIGTYKVTVNMIGNYIGTKTLTFTIVPTDKTAVSAFIGDKISIGAKSNKTITYKSSNTSVATVNSKGVITAVKAGTATVTVKSGDMSCKITVKVTKPSIKISAASKSMYVGEKTKMNATVKPAGTKVTWSVSNTKLAKITEAGTLKALDEGTVTITGKITYNGKTYTDTFKISITLDYPDISIYAPPGNDDTFVYAFSIVNNSSTKELKILGQGTVKCDGESQKIGALYIGDEDLYSWVSIKQGRLTMAVILEDELPFQSDETVYMDLYLEYGGEIFIAQCRSNIDGTNQCYDIDWIKT